ncbi:uncharacterized protein FIBRA_06383 [Fibroporia radiculosa]|uniref:F-box domain-containing protein n=1 Tax=Fibroporia radiculosa TaxID=599839 RepID=J4IB84_9APHY|nr:uncharacterized protein FIBRA_06383 [Fibroporia radiculosa]CCM04216.1 predicted protein [Fibroporia radiculosa]
MHHALSITELVRLIVEQIQIGDPPRLDSDDAIDPQTLAKLARTARVFREPALDRLWYRQQGIGNLVKCMSISLWEERPTREDRIVTEWCDCSSYLTFKRPVVPEDWERFHYYASRIRALDPPDGRVSCVGLAHGVFEALYNARLSSHLLPNLSTLYWDEGYHSTAFKFGTMFLGPSLTRLAIGVHTIESVPIAALLLAHLPSLAHRVRKIDIVMHSEGLIHDFFIPPTTLAALERLESFIYLSDTPLSMTAFTELSSLPALTTLRLEASSSWSGSMLVGPPVNMSHPYSFDALRNLEVEGRSIGSCISALNISRYPKLRAVMFDVDLGTSDTIQGLFEALSASSSCTELQRITFGVRCAYGGTRLDISLLRPVYDFHNLRSLILTPLFGVKLNINDRDLENMGIAWPYLDTMVFDYFPRSPSEVEPSATLKGLLLVARSWPALRRLQIEIDARQIDLDKTQQCHGQVVNECLREIHLCDSPVDGIEPTVVANFLSSIFPSVRRIETYAKQGESRWKMVEEILCSPCGHPVT